MKTYLYIYREDKSKKMRTETQDPNERMKATSNKTTFQ